MDFNKNIILENDRAKLIPLSSDHIEQLLPFSIHEPNTWEYSLDSAAGAEKMKAYIDNALEKRSNQDSYPFIVLDKKSNQYAGSTRYYDYQKRHNSVQLGYTWYGQEFRGTGLNKNCKFLMLEYAFEKLQLDRVEFRADNNNKRSIAAMKSIGCTVEGILRSHCAGQIARRDSIILSILKAEWQNDLKQKLVEKLKTYR